MSKMVQDVQRLWTRLSLREQMMAGFCALCVGIALAAQLLIVPYRAYLSDLQTQVETRQIKLAKYQHWLKFPQQPTDTELATQETTGNETDDMSQFLKTIEQIAHDSGTRLIDLKPVRADKQGIQEKVGLDLQLEAGLPALIHFLYQIQSAKALLKVGRFQLTAGEGSTLRVSILISQIFFLPEPVRRSGRTVYAR